jgi:hypothetical protein
MKLLDGWEILKRRIDMTPSGWIGVDLDGTLAEYHGWSGMGNIGKPVPLMLERVKKWLQEGITVKIMTARAGIPEEVPYIKKWLKEIGLPELEVTDKKDFGMIELWDDRCRQVVMNTGELVVGEPLWKK